MKYTKTINLDVNKPFYEVLHAKQNDNARYLLFNLLNNGVPFVLTDKTVRAYAIKPDGTKIYNDLTIINAINGQAELQLTSQMLAVPGMISVELVIFEGTDILSTVKFAIEVTGNLRNDDAIESTNEFSALINALASIDDLEVNYAPRLTTVESSLSEKANQVYVDTKIGDMVTTKTFKGSCLFSALPLTGMLVDDYWYVTDQETNYCYNGSTWGDIGNNLKIGDNTISEEKLSFTPVKGVKSKNLFDKTNIINGYYRHENAIVANELWVYSDEYVKISSPTQYYTNCVVFLEYYDINKIYLSGIVKAVGAFTPPTNSVYVRVSVKVEDLNILQIHLGTKPTVYESYGTFFDSEKTIQDKTISINKLSFLPISGIISKNMFNKNDTMFNEYVLMYSNGIKTAITGWCYSERYIEVLPSTEYIANKQPIHVCFYDVNKVYLSGIVTSTSFTTPINCTYIRVSIKAIDLNTFQIELGSTCTDYETYGFKIDSNENIANKSIDGTKLSDNVISVIADEVDTYVRAQPLPSQPSYSGLIKELPNFYSHYLKSDKDVVVVITGDSILTAFGQTGARADAMYRPPLCVENNLFSYIEEDLRWKGQEYNRFDAPTIFTEVATTKTTSDYDSAWDWQVGYGVTNLQENFKLAKTRILEGTNASVSYSYPANMRRCNFIYRTDYLSATSTTVTIAEGNGKVEVYDETTSTWIEANGYSFSAKETDTIIDYTSVNYLGASAPSKLRKSMYQKRLKMRSLTVLTAKTVTITNVGTGRLCYWGIEYSPKSNMITFINSARGGHNISRLRAYEEWEVDYWKPDLILEGCCIINEGAMSSANMYTGNKPSDFATRFLNYANDLKAKAYLPELLTFNMFIGSQANIVNQSTGKYNTGNIVGVGDVSIFDYIGALDVMYNTNNIVFINLFYEFLKLAELKATTEGTNNIWTSAILGSGLLGNTFTSDNVHLNDYGNKIAKTLFLPLFKFLY